MNGSAAERLITKEHAAERIRLPYAQFDLTE
jgi:hypothetical protein